MAVSAVGDKADMESISRFIRNEKNMDNHDASADRSRVGRGRIDDKYRQLGARELSFLMVDGIRKRNT